MVPNIMMVHPPRTHWGKEEKNCPTGGRSPARSIMAAPLAMVKRLTTLVMAMRPTFCEKEVTGQQPKRAEMEEAKPSQAKEPEISFSVISRFRPVTTMAVVSPMVSVAETKKMIQVERMAPMLNTGITGRMWGREIRPFEKMRV